MFVNFKKKMNAEQGDGGGGGEQVEAPPVEQQVPAEQTPPAADPMAQRLAMLEQQNLQLMRMMQMQQAQPMSQPQAPGQESDTVDESQLHPELVKLLRKKDQQYEQRMNALRDQLDYSQYKQQLTMSGVPQEVQQQAEGLYGAWQKSGMRVADASGNMVPPSRMDAMRFVMGQLAFEGKLPAFKQALPAMQGGALRSAPPATPVVTVDTAKMSREQRIQFYESQLDAEGF